MSTDSRRLGGRMAVVADLATRPGRSLSIGCKETRLATVNADIDESVRPDVLSDVRRLPFASRSFDVVFFTEVLNLVPTPDERRSLEEIRRVLKPGGQLILTVPNRVRLYRWLNVGRFYTGARSYSKERIERLLDETRYEIDELFTAGNVFEPLAYLWYCLVNYPLSKVWQGRDWPYAPKPLKRRSDEAYENYEQIFDGCTIFTRAIRP